MDLLSLNFCALTTVFYIFYEVHFTHHDIPVSKRILCCMK